MVTAAQNKLDNKAVCSKMVNWHRPVGPNAGIGEVPERLNGAVSKTVEPSRVPRVRIPASPLFCAYLWVSSVSNLPLLQKARE